MQRTLLIGGVAVSAVVLSAALFDLYDRERTGKNALAVAVARYRDPDDACSKHKGDVSPTLVLTASLAAFMMCTGGALIGTWFTARSGSPSLAGAGDASPQSGQAGVHVRT